jgi:hypothetical protein
MRSVVMRNVDMLNVIMPIVMVSKHRLYRHKQNRQIQRGTLTDEGVNTVDLLNKIASFVKRK